MVAARQGWDGDWEFVKDTIPFDKAGNAQSSPPTPTTRHGPSISLSVFSVCPHQRRRRSHVFFVLPVFKVTGGVVAARTRSEMCWSRWRRELAWCSGVHYEGSACRGQVRQSGRGYSRSSPRPSTAPRPSLDTRWSPCSRTTPGSKLCTSDFCLICVDMFVAGRVQTHPLHRLDVRSCGLKKLEAPSR